MLNFCFSELCPIFRKRQSYNQLISKANMDICSSQIASRSILFLSSSQWPVDLAQLTNHGRAYEFSISNSSRRFYHRIRIMVCGVSPECQAAVFLGGVLPKVHIKLNNKIWHLPNSVQNLLSFGWDGDFISMASRMSSSPVIARKGPVALPEVTVGNMYRDIPECLLLVPAREMRECNQDSGDWILITKIFGGMASSSQLGSNSVNYQTPSLSWAFHHLPPAPSLPWRLSDAVRMPLLPSFTFAQLCQVPSVSTVMVQNGVDPQRQQFIWSALLIHSLDDAPLEGSLSSRLFTAGNEGWSMLVSEDLLLFNQSVFSQMTDLHDQYRDMRLDLDNMSYEELLALEDRIGIVSTGLAEETVAQYLKHTKYVFPLEKNVSEPCSICQEEFMEDDEMGMLDCGHDFHTACIKEWLFHKNVCPVCKSTALNTSDAHVPTITL